MKKKLLGATALLLCLLLLGACSKPQEEASGEEPQSSSYQNVYDDGGNLLVEYFVAEDGSYNGKREFFYEESQMKKRVYDKNDILIHETAEEYDAQGNLLLSCEVEYISEKERIQTQYTYYEDGNEKDITTKHYFDDIALCIWTMQVYNEKQQLIRWNEYTSEGELAWYEAYEYEGDRRVKTIMVNKNPYNREYSLAYYNENGEHIRETYYDCNDKVTREDAFEWANGNQIRSVSRKYDSQGRVSKETVNIPATGEKTVAEYDYEMRDPDTYKISYTHFFQDDRQWRDSEQYFEDMQLGVHAEVTTVNKYQSQPSLFYYHCENNRIYRISLGNYLNKNYHILFQYDSQGRRTGYKYYDTEDNLLETVVYQWDGDRLAKEVFSDGRYDQYCYNEDGVFLGYESYDAKGNLEETHGSDFCPWVKMFESCEPK